MSAWPTEIELCTEDVGANPCGQRLHIRSDGHRYCRLHGDVGAGAGEVYVRRQDVASTAIEATKDDDVERLARTMANELTGFGITWAAVRAAAREVIRQYGDPMRRKA